MATTNTSRTVPAQREPAHDVLASRATASGVFHARAPRQPGRVAAVICVIGLLLTGFSTWATMRVDDNTEHRLLVGQTKQVGAVLTAAVQLLGGSLATALDVQPTSGKPDPAAFRRTIAASVGPTQLYVSASLWQRRGGRFVRLATVGAPPELRPGQPTTQALLRQALGAKTFVAQPYAVRGKRGIAYAFGNARTGLVVSGDRALPADRRSPVDKDSAFADLHYAFYLGRTADLTSLLATDVPLSSLPLAGQTSRVTIPFGTGVLTVVTSPREHLGAGLSRSLPLILLLSGLVLTLVAARAGQQLVRRRLEVETMYGQERVLSERLQRALLPPVIPEVPQLEVAVEYVAGARGVDIGGDWYSLVTVDDDRFAFVVGDVSGRGIDAVAVMARARFTLRAYLLRGDSPQDALEACSHQFDIAADGHMATTILGVGSWRTGEITVANAGHPLPLLLTADGAQFVETSVGPPLGIGPTRYQPTTFSMPPGSTLFCFTDGLIERRGESIDDGMDRLARVVQDAVAQPVEELVAHTVRTLRAADADDDIAVLALRRVVAS